MSFILFVFLLFVITIIYVWITLGTRYVNSFEDLVVMIVSYCAWAFLDFKYILQGLIHYDFTGILSVFNVFN
ncbi:hypothetical protein AVV44_gp148 [Cronobacter phage S13]|jgi:hypothetical protein|uniref:Uncharacterized protein n=1 Tax=Cronobacter phage LPCS28 TaxID=2924885 RepID=A0AAE9GBD6_9CAUD|nr:hypothetical protein AVV44_gp148 [Cronobacter phage S13]YP_010665732.1 hypothetical protein PQB73_gp014 [Cronobacter phage LPCS28]AIA64947.1 hypothetical protein S13_148 [Cronobacter phage S13]UNY46921.1 hypothetical protein EHEKIMEA_00014 [Cronobacter phage LPCS28]